MLVRKLVVAGLIVREDGALLVTQRREDQALPLFWELPGGKVESGEAPVDALARELREELAVEVEIGRVWDVMHHVYPDYEVVMLVYPCRLRPGQEPSAREVRDLAWVPPDRLDRYHLLPADEPLVARLKAEPPVY